MRSVRISAGVGIDEADVQRLETSVGPLPEEYRNFLLRYNGGEPDMPGDDERFWSQWPVSSFYSLAPSGAGRLVAANYNLGLGPRLLAIGDDGGGNQTCLVLEGEDRGSVVFLDHEEGTEEVLAGTFLEFLEPLMAPI